MKYSLANERNRFLTELEQIFLNSEIAQVLWNLTQDENFELNPSQINLILSMNVESKIAYTQLLSNYFKDTRDIISIAPRSLNAHQILILSKLLDTTNQKIQESCLEAINTALSSSTYSYKSSLDPDTQKIIFDLTKNEEVKIQSLAIGLIGNCIAAFSDKTNAVTNIIQIADSGSPDIKKAAFKVIARNKELFTNIESEQKRALKKLILDEKNKEESDLEQETLEIITSLQVENEATIKTAEETQESIETYVGNTVASEPNNMSLESDNGSLDEKEGEQEDDLKIILENQDIHDDSDITSVSLLDLANSITAESEPKSKQNYATTSFQIIDNGISLEEIATLDFLTTGSDIDYLIPEEEEEVEDNIFDNYSSSIGNMIDNLRESEMSDSHEIKEYDIFEASKIENLTEKKFDPIIDIKKKSAWRLLKTSFDSKNISLITNVQTKDYLINLISSNSEEIKEYVLLTIINITHQNKAGSNLFDDESFIKNLLDLTQNSNPKIAKYSSVALASIYTSNRPKKEIFVQETIQNLKSEDESVKSKTLKYIDKICLSEEGREIFSNEPLISALLDIIPSSNADLVNNSLKVLQKIATQQSGKKFLDKTDLKLTLFNKLSSKGLKTTTQKNILYLIEKLDFTNDEKSRSTLNERLELLFEISQNNDSDLTRTALSIISKVTPLPAALLSSDKIDTLLNFIESSHDESIQKESIAIILNLLSQDKNEIQKKISSQQNYESLLTAARSLDNDLRKEALKALVIISSDNSIFRLYAKDNKELLLDCLRSNDDLQILPTLKLINTASGIFSQDLLDNEFVEIFSKLEKSPNREVQEEAKKAITLILKAKVLLKFLAIPTNLTSDEIASSLSGLSENLIFTSLNRYIITTLYEEHNRNADHFILKSILKASHQVDEYLSLNDLSFFDEKIKNILLDFSHNENFEIQNLALKSISHLYKNLPTVLFNDDEIRDLSLRLISSQDQDLSKLALDLLEFAIENKETTLQNFQDKEIIDFLINTLSDSSESNIESILKILILLNTEEESITPDLLKIISDESAKNFLEITTCIIQNSDLIELFATQNQLHQFFKVSQKLLLSENDEIVESFLNFVYTLENYDENVFEELINNQLIEFSNFLEIFKKPHDSYLREKSLAFLSFIAQKDLTEELAEEIKAQLFSNESTLIHYIPHYEEAINLFLSDNEIQKLLEISAGTDEEQSIEALKILKQLSYSNSGTELLYNESFRDELTKIINDSVDNQIYELGLEIFLNLFQKEKFILDEDSSMNLFSYNQKIDTILSLARLKDLGNTEIIISIIDNLDNEDLFDLPQSEIKKLLVSLLESPNENITIAALRSIEERSDEFFSEINFSEKEINTLLNITKTKTSEIPFDDEEESFDFRTSALGILLRISKNQYLSEFTQIQNSLIELLQDEDSTIGIISLKIIRNIVEESGNKKSIIFDTETINRIMHLAELYKEEIEYDANQVLNYIFGRDEFPEPSYPHTFESDDEYSQNSVSDKISEKSESSYYDYFEPTESDNEIESTSQTKLGAKERILERVRLSKEQKLQDRLNLLEEKQRELEKKYEELIPKSDNNLSNSNSEIFLSLSRQEITQEKEQVIKEIADVKEKLSILKESSERTQSIAESALKFAFIAQDQTDNITQQIGDFDFSNVTQIINNLNQYQLSALRKIEDFREEDLGEAVVKDAFEEVSKIAKSMSDAITKSQERSDKNFAKSYNSSNTLRTKFEPEYKDYCEQKELEKNPDLLTAASAIQAKFNEHFAASILICSQKFKLSEGKTSKAIKCVSVLVSNLPFGSLASGIAGGVSDYLSQSNREERYARLKGLIENTDLSLATKFSEKIGRKIALTDQDKIISELNKRSNPQDKKKYIDRLAKSCLEVVLSGKVNIDEIKRETVTNPLIGRDWKDAIIENIIRANGDIANKEIYFIRESKLDSEPLKPSLTSERLAEKVNNKKTKLENDVEEMRAIIREQANIINQMQQRLIEVEKALPANNISNVVAEKLDSRSQISRDHKS